MLQDWFLGASADVHLEESDVEFSRTSKATNGKLLIIVHAFMYIVNLVNLRRTCCV